MPTSNGMRDLAAILEELWRVSQSRSLVVESCVDCGLWWISMVDIGVSISWYNNDGFDGFNTCLFSGVEGSSGNSRLCCEGVEGISAG